jgi:tRNA A37 threonylcarbamoyladenosine synthetase subunit TsaC/SUA5/YrdC
VNRRGGTALNDPKIILKEFRAEIDLFINSGRLIGNKGSSIYQLDHGKLIQLRS